MKTPKSKTPKYFAGYIRSWPLIATGVSVNKSEMVQTHHCSLIFSVEIKFLR